MTEKYTPERVDEARVKLEQHAMRRDLGAMPKHIHTVLDALAAVSAERDWHRSHYERLLQEKVTLRADRDRLHKAITEALGELGDPESKGPWLSGNIPNAVRRILRAALDKEGNDDD